MERLTYRDKAGNAMMAFEHEEKHTTQEWIDLLENRLAEYEDTGLEPEDLAKIKKYEVETKELIHDLNTLMAYRMAEQEGRLVVLPCAVGTEVYQLKNVVSRGYPDPVTKIEIFKEAFTYDHLRYWGKSCFLSSEEAEVALRKEEAE